LEESAKPRDLLSFTASILGGGFIHRSLTEREYAELVMLRIHALFRSANADDAVETCETILKSSEASHLLRMWVLIALLSWYPINDRYERALELAKQNAEQVDGFSASDQDLRIQLINNLAFTFAEGGLVDEALRFISLISHRVHRDCYPTATLGLIHVRKGDFDRGKKLYEEAVRLALHQDDKVRIRQKYLLELAKNDINKGDYRRALKNLARVAFTKNGENGLVRSSQRLMLSLR
jgi:tetratricopeptide (TPR) repeat protein